jgi:hypothetical protein
LHATSHGTPAGHFTVSGQGCASSQVMTQSAPLQVPLVQAFLQSAAVASAPPEPDMPPLLPATGALPPLLLPATGAPPPSVLLPAVALPPVALLPAVAVDCPPLLVEPPEPLSNRSFSAGPPHAAAQITNRPAHQARPQTVSRLHRKGAMLEIGCASSSSTGWSVPLTTTRV